MTLLVLSIDSLESGRSTQRLLLACLLCVACCVGCADLSLIEGDVCGNKVTEPTNNEECDGQTNCHPAGSAFECRLLCSDEIECPAGYGCGKDNVCRLPSGGFELVADVLTTATLGLFTGDFDGDGRVDLLRESDNETVVQYYGEGFVVTSTATLSREPDLVAPLVTNLNDDQLVDIAVGSETIDKARGSGVVVYRSESVGSFASTTYSTLAIPTAPSNGSSGHAHLILARTKHPHLTDNILAIVDPHPSEGQSELVGVSDEGDFVPIPTENLSFQHLAGVVVGELNPGLPCEEIAYVQSDQGAGKDAVWLVSPCNAQNEWNTTLDPQKLELGNGVEVVDLSLNVGMDDFGSDLLPLKGRRALFIADWNNDGLDDLLVYARKTAMGAAAFDWHVALQDTLGGFASSSFQQVGINPSSPGLTGCIDDENWQWGPPLGVADFNGDGTIDMVHEKAIVTAYDVQMAPMSMSRNGVECLTGGAAWGLGAVADFDRNGTTDLVMTRIVYPDLSGAVPVTGLDVRIGSGDGLFAASTISTKQPVELLSAGDFDGDLVKDISWVELNSFREDAEDVVASDEVFAAFGRTSGGFEQPTKLGDLRLVEHMIAGRVAGGDSTDDILVLSRPSPKRLAVAPISGSASRQLVAPYFLAFADTSEDVVETITTEVGALVAGQFGGSEEERQFAVVTSDVEGKDLRFWLVQASGDQVDMDAKLHSSQATEPSGVDCGECVFAAVDTDADGVDELVVFATAVSAADGQVLPFRSSISEWVVSNDKDGKLGFETASTPTEVDDSFALTFARVSATGPVNIPRVKDLDGDGNDDVVLLANTDPRTDQIDGLLSGELVIFWNDGAMTPDNMARLTSETYAVVDFTLLQADADPELEIVVSTEERASLFLSLRVIDIDTNARTITPLDEAPELPVQDDVPVFPESLVSGDFDGDGVGDIATGDFIGYTVLRGVPAAP